MTGGFLPETYRTVSEQLLLFGGSVLLGVPAGILFDCMRLVRKMIRHHAAAVMAEDAAFLTAVSFLLLCYVSAFARGEFRIYYAAGCLTGFLMYECTAGRVTVRLASGVLHVLLLPVRAAGTAFALICKKVCGRFVRNSKKNRNCQKNR